jgi:hypothetical protein
MQEENNEVGLKLHVLKEELMSRSSRTDAGSVVSAVSLYACWPFRRTFASA